METLKMLPIQKRWIVPYISSLYEAAVFVPDLEMELFIR